MSRARLPTKWALGLLPAAAFFLIFFVLPELEFLRRAFYVTDNNGELTGSATLHTFAQTADSYYLHALFRTIELCVLASIITLAIAYPLAYTIVRSRRWSRLVFIPVVAAMFSSAVARVLGWQVLLSPTGPVNRVLLDLHLTHDPIQLLNNFTGVVIGTIHAVLPLAVIGLMPACEIVREEQMEAARSLGGGSVRCFTQVFFPQTRAAVLSVGLLLFAIVAGTFTTPALLGGGRVAILSISIYTLATQLLDYSTAAVLALVLLVTVAVTVLAGLVIGRHGYQTQAGGASPPATRLKGS